MFYIHTRRVFYILSYALQDEQAEESINHGLGSRTCEIREGMERVERTQRTERRVIDWDEYEDHMLWYDDGIKHRLRLRPQWTTADAEDLFDDASENEAYNESIRQLQGGFREYGPLMNRVVCCFYLF